MCTERCIFKITIFWMLRRVVSYINTNFGVSCGQQWHGFLIITATDSSESLVNIYKSTRRHIPRHSAMIHSVSRRPLTVESQVPSHATAYGIYGGKVGNGTGFSLQKLQFFLPKTSVFPSKNFSISLQKLQYFPPKTSVFPPKTSVFPSKNFSFSTISAILPIIQTHSSTTAAI